MAACCAVAAYIIMRVLALSSSPFGRSPLHRLQSQESSQPLEISDRKSTIKVGGITCAACVQGIERELRARHGVLSTTVSLATHEAVVNHSSAVARTDLVAAIESIGYEADIVDVDDPGISIEAVDQERLAAFMAWKAALIAATIGTLATMVVDYLPWSILKAQWNKLLLQAASCAFVVVVCGFQIHYEAARAVWYGRTDMSLLTSLGTLLALLKSLSDTIMVHQEIADRELLFRSTAFLSTVIIGGRFLKAIVMRQSSASVVDLSMQMPESVKILNPGSGAESFAFVPLSAVKKGDCLVIHPGDIVPVEGIVAGGSGFVSETHLNGEILPVKKSTGEIIFEGSVNQDTQFLLEVTRAGRVTRLQRALQLITEGNSRKSGIQEIADMVAGRSIGITLIIAFAVGVIQYSRGASFRDAADRLVAVLLCACPCAIGLASPTAVTIGIGNI